MNMLCRMTCTGLAIVLPAVALAQTPGEKMAGCESKARAAELNGPQRKAFIQRCVTGAPEPAKAVTPQEKMADCEHKARAAELRGPQRQAYIQQCIKS